MSGDRRALLVITAFVGIVNFAAGAAADSFVDACTAAAVGLYTNDCRCFAEKVIETGDLEALLAYFRVSREIHEKGATPTTAETESQLQVGMGLVGKYLSQCHR